MSQYAIDQGERIKECLAAVVELISNHESSLYSVIQDNEACRANSAELERLYAALKTYLDTDFDLRYVAFVGAFSSGKTATINNLLRLEGEERRAEDPNPVDDRLTICVHETRRSSVINALLKSTWDHDKFFHQADDLSAIILVDTPGGGDPKIRTDIVYNFLPICDTIVYFFNATNPLNINDLPILRELNQVLQHTDFFYVYSRADNVFKLQDSLELTQENFDVAKAARQKEVFSARLTEALAGIPVKGIELMGVGAAATAGPNPRFDIDELCPRALQPIRRHQPEQPLPQWQKSAADAL